MSTTTGPTLAQTYLAELEQELDATRALLDRIPEDRLAWKPHARSMSVGQLGLHIAACPNVAQMAQADELPLPEFTEERQPDSKAEILAKLDESMGNAREILSAMDDERIGSPWRVLKGTEEVMNIPKAGVIRGILLNHLYHHRGQLTVYLRLLDVAVPSTYGQSADERPFA